MTDAALPTAQPRQGAQRQRVRRHSVVTRVTHWINLLALVLLLMSGLQILNAHPALYWGQYGANTDHHWLAFANGIPSWMTLPHYQDLATGRRWHFFFAWVFVINGAVYLLVGLINGHLKRDIAPTREELSPRHLAQDILDHLRLNLPKGEAARHYNTLQKIAYLKVVALLLPLMVLTGLTMSPGFNAVAPVLLDLFGGRQSARSIHFICANLIVLFVVVHVVMVFIAGAVNEIRSMITGWYEIEPEDAP
jgi:thiosulfate reductase cytochrome b subunit